MQKLPEIIHPGSSQPKQAALLLQSLTAKKQASRQPEEMASVMRSGRYLSPRTGPSRTDWRYSATIFR
jgi:hypothetical protein